MGTAAFGGQLHLRRAAAPGRVRFRGPDRPPRPGPLLPPALGRRRGADFDWDLGAVPGPARRAGRASLTDAVYVTYPLPGPGLDMLGERFEVRVHESETKPTADEIVADAAGCAGIVPPVRHR